MKQYFVKGQTGPNNATVVIESTCPGCGREANFAPESGGKHMDFIDNESGRIFTYGIRVCPSKSCKALIFFHYDAAGYEETEVYPTANLRLGVNAVPVEVAEDAFEALSCLQASAYKGSVVMCRRVIQVVCELHKAKGANLKEQIDELYERGIISSQLKDWAHQIRYFGNFAAHPDPAFGKITLEDAKSMIRFMRTFLQYVYEMPAEIASAQARSGKA